MVAVYAENKCHKKIGFTINYNKYRITICWCILEEVGNYLRENRLNFDIKKAGISPAII